jgi:Tfp pilus assembly protein PilF
VTPQIYYNLALACLMNKNNAQAGASLDRALALQTNYVDAILLLARIHITQAEAVVAKANQKNTTGLELRLGDVPAARGEVNQAEAALLKAIEISPDYRPAYQSLASLYVSCNRTTRISPIPWDGSCTTAATMPGR